MDSLPVGLIASLRTVSQILTAGIAITAFSLLLYSLTFNLKERVARSFAVITLCVVIVYTAEAIGSAASDVWQIEFWLRIQWVGAILMPAAFFNFSDALLATTGKPSRGKRTWVVRLTYLTSFGFLVLLPFSTLTGPVIVFSKGVAHLQTTPLTSLFNLFYLCSMVLSWINFSRAYRRTITPTSRRRMSYLVSAAIAPALGAFPPLMVGSQLAAEHPTIFWLLSVLSGILVGTMVVAMAYSVAFFGVPWPDRVVKTRLFKWLMRGPVTASITLGLVTIVRRAGEMFGTSYSALVPIVMASAILLMEYLITLFAPFWEKILLFGKDDSDIDLIRQLEDRLLTKNDLKQFMEMILASVCDRLQAKGAYLIAMNSEGLEQVVTIGRTNIEGTLESKQLLEMVSHEDDLPDIFKWGEDFLIPLFKNGDSPKEVMGLLGISGASVEFSKYQMQDLNILVERATLALKDRRAQQQIYNSLQDLAPQVDLIQRIRAAGYVDKEGILEGNPPVPSEDLTIWVKEALTHYWGGPKLTESPLLQFKVVQDAVEAHEGNQANALRSILKEAIERTRPEGERRFTGEWILYNILEMKFLEGRKVREVALRLAMSEADLYRKQRVAIEAVSKEILDMEAQARHVQ
jgi:hypothetical protein